jgi:hemerythrin-like domain-containing protein
MSSHESRRRFLSVAVAGVGLSLADIAGAEEKGHAASKPNEDVGPTEDLMREHGVLRRVLLVYGAAVDQLSAGHTPPVEALASAARLIQRFVEGYHEKIEEEHVFPRMEKDAKHAELVRVLKEQHHAGRGLTAQILAGATPSALGNPAQRTAVVEAIHRFTRMYQPHAAREDTVLFPAFHELFTPAEFDKLGDQFEEQEHKLLGASGFEGAVGEVAQLEKALNIHDLSAFTPR